MEIFPKTSNFKKFVLHQFSTDFDNFWFFEKFYVCTLQENYVRMILSTLEAPNQEQTKNVTRFPESLVPTFLMLEIIILAVLPDEGSFLPEDYADINVI